MSNKPIDYTVICQLKNPEGIKATFPIPLIVDTNAVPTAATGGHRSCTHVIIGLVLAICNVCLFGLVRGHKGGAHPCMIKINKILLKDQVRFNRLLLKRGNKKNTFTVSYP